MMSLVSENDPTPTSGFEDNVSFKKKLTFILGQRRKRSELDQLLLTNGTPLLFNKLIQMLGHNKDL